MSVVLVVQVALVMVVVEQQNVLVNVVEHVVILIV